MLPLLRSILSPPTGRLHGQRSSVCKASRIRKTSLITPDIQVVNRYMLNHIVRINNISCAVSHTRIFTDSKPSINVPLVSANCHCGKLARSLCSRRHASLQNSLSQLPPKTTQSRSRKFRIKFCKFHDFRQADKGKVFRIEIEHFPFTGKLSSVIVSNALSPFFLCFINFGFTPIISNSGM